MRTQKYIPLRGRTDGVEPAAGDVGEYKTAVLAAGSATALVTATAKTICSISVTGDWDVWGAAGSLPAATTSMSDVAVGISLVDNTLPAQDDGTITLIRRQAYVPGLNLGDRLPTPMRRVLSAIAVNVYLIFLLAFTVSTATGYGRIQGRRRV